MTHQYALGISGGGAKFFCNSRLGCAATAPVLPEPPQENQGREAANHAPVRNQSLAKLGTHFLSDGVGTIMLQRGVAQLAFRCLTFGTVPPGSGRPKVINLRTGLCQKLAQVRPDGSCRPRQSRQHQPHPDTQDDLALEFHGS